MGSLIAEVRPLFELLGRERCVQVQAVTTNMNTAYDLEARQHRPNARVIYDLLHVIAKYGPQMPQPLLAQHPQPGPQTDVHLPA